MPASPYPDNLLYHQYLRGDTHIFDDDFIQSSAAACQTPDPFHQQSDLFWDLPSICKPISPAFHYISQRLAKHGLQISLILSHHEPFFIPIWPLPRKSQIIFTGIVRNARARFNMPCSWMTALASVSSKRDLPKIFETHKPNEYIIRRSILQQEIIFFTEGLTLLSIDHVYTLKQLLCSLSKRDRGSYSRETCLSSCVELLHRINSIHKGIRFSKGYIARVYQEIPLQETALDEVMAEYDANFCTARIRDIAAELDFGVFADEKSDPRPAISVAERQDVSTNRTGVPDEIMTPLLDVDLSTLHSWEAETVDINLISPVTVTYPPIRRPSDPPSAARDAELWHHSVPSSPSSDRESWGPFAPPPPLRIVKRASTHPQPVRSTSDDGKSLPLVLQDWGEKVPESEVLEAESREIINAWLLHM